MVNEIIYGQSLITNLVVTSLIATNLVEATKKINITTYFENLTFLFFFLIFNTHQILYQSDIIYYLIQKLFLCIILNYKNLKFNHFIDDIDINI